jgi:2-dehydro-3-deoxyphosphooctonate aldolase (KDO 8-P synthase)
MPPKIHPAVSDLFDRRRLTLIAGPCVAESYALCHDLAEVIAAMCASRNIGYIFKASFDKANRTAIDSFRGGGMQAGLDILQRVRQSVGVPVITDIHTPDQAAPVAAAVDVLQIPAFLCRQTDLLAAAAATGCPTNIKKGQFLAPQDSLHIVEKFRQSSPHAGPVALTERGSCFGYHNLVVDMRSLTIMRATAQVPIVFDATHSVQLPGALGKQTGGDRQMARVLARAAAAVGIDGLFCEIHFDPDRALSDGPNSLTPAMLEDTLDAVCAIAAAAAPWKPE